MCLRKTILLIGVISILFACTKKIKEGTPVGNLGEYVSRTFAIDSLEDKTRLIELTTDQVKETITGMSDLDFKKKFLDEKKKFVSLKIKDERSLSDDRYSITYELTYKNKTENSEAQVLTKKHAIFRKIDGKWLIAEVQNLKTFIEHQNEMSF